MAQRIALAGSSWLLTWPSSKGGKFSWETRRGKPTIGVYPVGSLTLVIHLWKRLLVVKLWKKQGSCRRFLNTSVHTSSLIGGWVLRIQWYQLVLSVDLSWTTSNQ